MQRINAVIKYPRTTACRCGVNDPPQTIYNVRCSQLTPFTIGKHNIVLEINIRSQVKRIHSAVFTYVPTPGE